MDAIMLNYANQLIDHPELESDAKKELREWLRKRKRKQDVQPSKEQQRYNSALNEIAQQFRFSEDELASLRLMFWHEQDKAVRELVKFVDEKLHLSHFQMIHYCTNIPFPQVKRMMNRTHLLWRIGVIDHTSESPGIFSFFNEVFLDQTFKQAIYDFETEKNSVQSLFAKASPRTALSQEDFQHMAEWFERLKSVLSSALNAKLPGVNVLLYGPPGTGKTELCRLLAQGLGIKLYEAGALDEEEPGRDKRMSHLQMLQHLLAGQKDCVLLFDEMEDLTVNWAGVRDRQSKWFQNRMLEENPLPVLWTSNDIDDVDPAFLRRMSVILEVPIPPLSVREQIWKKQAIQYPALGASISQKLPKLAHDYQLPPSISQNALQIADMSQGNADTLYELLNEFQQVLEPARKRSLPKTACETALLPLDDGGIGQWLDQPEPIQPVSVCLYGPPGTGKTAMVAHIAERLGMEVLCKMPSDILSCLVGGTEKAIASAFAEARRRRSFLLFDEADGFLTARDTLGSHYDVTAVNEFLGQMERHPLPFACTTNRFEMLDPAAIRRFTFKVHCPYLKAAQINEACQHFFGFAAPDDLSHAERLTPSDFVQAQKRARLMNKLDDQECIVKLLAEEVAARPHQSAPAGFMRHLH